MSLLTNSHVQSFATLAGARFKTQERLGSKPPDSDRSIKAASSKRKMTIFARNWCFLALDEVHEYRGEKSRQFIGAVAISKRALAVVGVSATPVMSNAKVCSYCGRPRVPSHHRHLFRTFSTSRAFFVFLVATERMGRSSSWSTTGTSQEPARKQLQKIASKLSPHCRIPFKREQPQIVQWIRW